MNWLLARLREPSTLRAIVVLLSYYGIFNVPVEMQQHVVDLGVTLICFIEVMREEDGQ